MLHPSATPSLSLFSVSAASFFFCIAVFILQKGKEPKKEKNREFYFQGIYSLWLVCVGFFKN